jgi:hypothetical protein
MKTKFQLAALALLLSTLNSQLSTCLGQGALTPPGPPAPTMKSLAQIEARTPISTAPFTITQPGSYYLTTNVTVSGGNAITIATNGVTLDLNGFSISSTEASPTGTAILLNGSLRNITIANGLIQGGVTNNGSGVYSGPGFANGIYCSGSQPINARVSGISVSGCQYDGIDLGHSGTVVEGCVVQTVGGYGIVAGSVSDSTAENFGNSGVYAYTANNCYGSSSAIGGGVIADTAINCRGSSSSGNGVYATTANNCYGSSSSGNGVYAFTANNCYGSSSSGTGVYAWYTATGCYGSSSSGTGLFAPAALNCNGSSSGSGSGVSASIANNCYGYSSSGYGVGVSFTATGCDGYSYSGTGLYAFIANVCHGTGNPGLSSPHPVNSY